MCGTVKAECCFVDGEMVYIVFTQMHNPKGLFHSKVVPNLYFFCGKVQNIPAS